MEGNSIETIFKGFMLNSLKDHKLADTGLNLIPRLPTYLSFEQIFTKRMRL